MTSELENATNPLPPLKKGWVRYVHIGARAMIDTILKEGFDYTNQKFLAATALRAADSQAAWDHILKGKYDPNFDPRYKLEGGKAVYIIDMPAEHGGLHESVTGAPGVIAPEYIRAIVDGGTLAVTHEQPSPKTWAADLRRTTPAEINGPRGFIDSEVLNTNAKQLVAKRSKPSDYGTGVF